MRQTATLGRQLLLMLPPETILHGVRSERLSSQLIARFDFFDPSLDPRRQSEAGPVMAVTAYG